MSRRHHHHNIQPYDYDRFSQQTRDRDQARGIEYQDDSLSSINSDEESYLHHSHGSKEKKSSYFSVKTDGKSNKTEKSANTEEFYQKNTKNSNNAESSSTIERLGRLENLLEELLKRNPTQSTAPSLSEKGEKSKEGQFNLDPRRHDFTTSMWINKIQEISFQNKWTEKETIQYMETQISGIVKAWYKSLSNYDLTWPEWKIQITKIFPDNTDFVTTLKRLVTRLRQSDESITTYYFSKMYLIEACKITGEDAVSCLIDGLNNQTIQEQAKTHNFLTPESLYSQFLMSLPDYSVDYSPSAPTTETLNNWYYSEPVVEDESVEVAVSSGGEFIEYEKDGRNDDFDYRNQSNNSGFPGNEENRSHLIKSPQKRMGTVHSRLDKRFIRPNHFRKHNKIPMAAKVCTICHSRGHLAKQCRNVDKVFLCTSSVDKPKSCFYVDCKINDRKVQGFIDTGCTTVTIKEQDVRMLNLPIISISDHIRVYGGGIVRILGQVEVVLQVESAKARVRALVVPNHVQEVSVIIGEEFLTRKNVSMFLKNSTLKISEASSTFKLTE